MKGARSSRGDAFLAELRRLREENKRLTLKIKQLREVVTEAAWEWQSCVEVDFAPMSCEAHIGRAFDEFMVKEN